MRVETRGATFVGAERLLLIAENDEESKMIDKIMGDLVDENGRISGCYGEVKLSDGYGEHYISLVKGEAL